MEEWKNQNPNATVGRRKSSHWRFQILLSDEILKSADKLIDDGVLRKKLEILERKIKERSDEEKEKVIDDFLLENNLYGLNQDKASELCKNNNRSNRRRKRAYKSRASYFIDLRIFIINEID